MSVTVPSDSELVAAVVNGDVKAFAVLVERYRNLHFRFAVRMLGDHTDAEDALQSAFVRAYRNLRKCREPERFGAWLYRIVINECRTFEARRTRRQRRFVPYHGIEPGDLAAPNDMDAGTAEEIQRALSLLPVDQREAFVLKHVEDLSYEEMSDFTGVGVSALKMRVKRACERLRSILEEVPQ
jgi:RNA polymerase sigma-70 factor (ECF subfamily)